ncbi:MAG: PQ-loop domain-containing transporter [Lysobacteraceae bacterium]
MEAWLGWSASGVLLVTLACQVARQWRSGSVEGVSPWLFAGQVTASVGFVLYSWLLDNWVFVVTNLAILATALAGQVVYRRNLRRSRERGD